jgi:hypothetical protein
MSCFVCGSHFFLTTHGEHEYCSQCIDENWCIHENDHCCKCNKQNDTYNTSDDIKYYNNKSYCYDCYNELKSDIITDRCCICYTNRKLENIYEKFYCNDCATETFKIKKCEKCNIRHLKEVCIYDIRFDPENSKYNICNICERIHLNPDDCKYCIMCREYVPSNYVHCEFCGDCSGELNRQH